MAPGTALSCQVRHCGSGREALLSPLLGFAPALLGAKKNFFFLLFLFFLFAKKNFFTPCKAAAFSRKK